MPMLSRSLPALQSPILRFKQLSGLDSKHHKDSNTSKSCKLRISESGGRLFRRSCLAFSSFVISTLTFCTVPISTGPRLRRAKSNEKRSQKNDTNAYCFSGGRLLVIASGGCIGSYSALGTVSGSCKHICLHI